MTHPMSRLALTLALLGAALSAPAAALADGAYVAVTLPDAGARQAVEFGLAELRGAAWLAAPKLALASIAQAERAGGRYRVTAIVKDGPRERAMQLEVKPGAGAGHRLTRVVLGPVGGTALQPDVPAANDLPGGWTERRPTDADVREDARVAADMLKRPEWIGRPVRWTGPLTAARSQVVAGTNLYVAGPATVGGVKHPVALVVYQSPAGDRTVSWVAISAP